MVQLELLGLIPLPFILASFFYLTREMRRRSRALDKALKKQDQDILTALRDFDLALDKALGIVGSQHIRIKVTEKYAERAFSLASSASIGVSILQRSLPTRKRPTAEESKRAKVSFVELAKGDPNFEEWNMPFMTDEEREMLELAERQEAKRNGTPDV